MSALPGYRLNRLLHRGSAFDVYEAWSDERQCPVIVKRARPGASPGSRRRLLHEGRLLHRFTHPHLVRAYEVIGEPRESVVLETLPGETLSHLFARRAPLSIADVAQLGIQVVSVVQYLHRHDVIHGDLKPGNATVSDGLVRVIDLSLAQRPGRWRHLAGTPGYLAPEQAHRDRVGPATDVWGLGMLLLEAASGEDPYPVGGPGYEEEFGPVAEAVPLRRRRRGVPVMSDLIAEMIRLDPVARPPLGDVDRQLRALVPTD